MHNITTPDNKFLQNAIVELKWDDDGNFASVQKVEVENDFKNGIDAVDALLSEFKPGDDAVYANGMTGRQVRILNSKAPNPAHYIREAISWDADNKTHIPRANLYIPAKIQWYLFDKLFFGQHSFEEVEIKKNKIGIDPSSVTSSQQNKQNQSSAGMLLYCEATVKLVLKLHNGNTITQTAIGFSQNLLPSQDLNNAIAYGQTMNLVVKGAVTAAKKEAISQLGEVFRIAHEDGSELHQLIKRHVQNLLEDDRRPAVHQKLVSQHPVPAPKDLTSLEKSSNTPLGDTTVSPEEEPQYEVVEASNSSEDVTLPSDTDPQDPDSNNYIEIVDGAKPPQTTSTESKHQVPNSGIIDLEPETHPTSKVETKPTSPNSSEETKVITAPEDISKGIETSSMSQEDPDADLQLIEAIQNRKIQPSNNQNNDILPEYTLSDNTLAELSDIKILPIKGHRRKKKKDEKPLNNTENDSEFNNDTTASLSVDNQGDEIPNFSLPKNTINELSDQVDDISDDDLLINASNMTGRSCLAAMKDLFATADTADTVNRIMSLNVDAIRRMTPTQVEKAKQAQQETLSRFD